RLGSPRAARPGSPQAIPSTSLRGRATTGRIGAIVLVDFWVSPRRPLQRCCENKPRRSRGLTEIFSYAVGAVEPHGLNAQLSTEGQSPGIHQRFTSMLSVEC